MSNDKERMQSHSPDHAEGKGEDSLGSVHPRLERVERDLGMLGAKIDRVERQEEAILRGITKIREDFDIAVSEEGLPHSVELLRDESQRLRHQAEAVRYEKIDPQLSQLEAVYARKESSYVAIPGFEPADMRRGEVRYVSEADVNVAGKENLVIVATNKGVVIEAGKHALATGGINGCGVAFIGGAREGMLHLTPSDFAELGYRRGSDQYSPAAFAVEKIAAALEGAGNPADYSIVIALNAGNQEQGSKFSQQTLNEDLENMRRLLEERGFDPEKITLVQVPVENSIAFHSPEDPHTLFLMGCRTAIGENGKQNEARDIIDTYTIRVGNPNAQPELYRTKELGNS